MFGRKKKKSAPLAALEHLQTGLSDRLQDTLHSAPVERLGDTVGTLRESAGEAASRAGELASRAGERAGEVASRAGEAASRASEAASRAWESVAHRDALRAIQPARFRQQEQDLPEQQSSTGEKLLWMTLGVAAGVAIGMLLAPASGRRSRSLLKDQVARAGHEASGLGAAAAGKVADLSNRAGGLAHELTNKGAGDGDPAEDGVVADRVRTALGQNPATSELSRLNIDCANGVVTVRGPMMDDATREALERVVRAVKGVHEARVDVLQDSSGDEPVFVG